MSTSDIAENLRQRIAAVQDELVRYDELRDELSRLEAALATLERGASRKSAPAVRTAASGARAKTPVQPRGRAPRASESDASGSSARIIAFLRENGPATAGEIAKGLGLKRNSVATRLTELTKDGHLTKVLRGYGIAEPSR